MSKKNANRTKKKVGATTQRLYTDVVRFDEIKRRREALGLTQTEAARKAGFGTQQRWANVENGRAKNPRIVTLFIVAGVLGCKVADLLRE